MNPHLLLRQTFLYDPHFFPIFTCGSTNVMWGHLRPVASFPFLWNWNEDKRNSECSNNLKKKIGTRTKLNLSRAKNICVSATLLIMLIETKDIKIRIKMKKGYFDLSSTTMSKEALSIDTCQQQWTGGPQGLWILHHVHLLRRRTLAPLQNVVYYTLNGRLWT